MARTSTNRSLDRGVGASMETSTKLCGSVIGNERYKLTAFMTFSLFDCGKDEEVSKKANAKIGAAGGVSKRGGRNVRAGQN
jgi:hypothetical protein